MKKILLDTNAFRKIFEGKDMSLLNLLDSAEIVYVSVIVIGELVFGFKGGSKENENRNLLDDFLEKVSVRTMAVSTETSAIYGEIMHKLKRKGLPIPTNDAWIAAHAIETGSVLITFDKHFLKIPGVRLWNKLTSKN